MISGLKSFWIKSPLPNAPMGFGVTAHSLVDAISIIRALGYGAYLPSDESELRVHNDVKVEDLDQRHIVPNMGAIVVRGMWYPHQGVGVPTWAEERMNSSKPSADGM